MYSAFEWLPVQITQILAGTLGRNGVSQTVLRCQEELQLMRNNRQRDRHYWGRLPLPRREKLDLGRLWEWSEGEIEDLRIALVHVEDYRRSGRRSDVIKARTRLQMADQANKQYLKLRLTLEPTLNDSARLFGQRRAA